MNNILHKLRALFLSPNSNFELTLRTIYHKIAATKIFFLWQNHLSNRSFRKYRSIQQNETQHDVKAFPHQPAVTFLLGYSETSLAAVHLTLQSIKSLHGERWEVLMFAASDVRVTELSGVISDARFQHINADMTNLLNHITGDYVIFCEAGDQFHHSLLLRFYRTLANQPSVDFVYYDCEYDHDQSGEPKPFFKPGNRSPALLLSVNYLSRGFIRFDPIKSLWKEITPHPEVISQEYAITLRLCEICINIVHIPALLVRQTSLVTANNPENNNIIEAHLSRQGLKAVSSSKEKTGWRFSWATGNPSLTIIIPSKNNCSYLEPLVYSLRNQPYQGQLSINIVDNDSDDPATKTYYQTLLQVNHDINIIPYNKPFNYSEAINLGVASSDSDLVLLLNDDMALGSERTIPELVQWAIRPEVGVVGAKLLRANHSIQHAGIILGLTGFMGHIYLNAPEHYNGLFGSVDWYRNYLAVTGACQMIRRDVFDAVGGYDPGYQLAFGDIAFCVKVHQKGYQIVYTPFAQLFHYEGSSRGYMTPVPDVLRGYDQLTTYMVEGDPFFSPNLTCNRIPKCVINQRSLDERKAQIAARRRFYLKNQQS